MGLGSSSYNWWCDVKQQCVDSIGLARWIDAGIVFSISCV